jgi:hypothetical protein
MTTNKEKIDAIGGLVAIILIITFFYSSCTRDDPETSESRGASSNHTNIAPIDIVKMNIVGENAVKTVLKDPDSATFKNQHIGIKGHPCGEVNSKNGFGGYTGFNRYIVASTTMIAIENMNTDPSEFEPSWDLFCK